MLSVQLRIYLHPCQNENEIAQIKRIIHFGFFLPKFKLVKIYSSKTIVPVLRY